MFSVVLNLKNSFISELANNAIGFTAYRTSTYDVDNNAAVEFDAEILDESNSYDVTSGTFTCPVNGMYFIIFTIFSEYSQASWFADVEIQDSSSTTTIGGLFNHDAHSLQSTNQAVIKCDAGSTMRVMNRDGGPRRVRGTEGGRPMSTFSGFLVNLL